MELFLLALGILMMSFAAFIAFGVARIAAGDKLEPEGGETWLLAFAAFNFGAGASFVAAAAIPATRPYSLWLGAALLLADAVRRLVFRRRLKRTERTERPG